MKKIIAISFILISFGFRSQAKLVRFAVNVSSTVVAQNDVYMTSNFQSIKNLGLDFQSGFMQMSQHPTDTNIYYYTIDLPAFQVYEYQMEKGATGYEKEWIPVESRSPNEYRWIYVDSLNNDTLKLPEVLFGDNNTTDKIMYRFQVNMSNQTVSNNGVHIAGDFQGNNPAATRMYSFANNIYEYMAWFTASTMQHFKYYNGNTASSVETVPTSCAMGGNRMIASISTAQILPVVCFNECLNCTPASTSELSQGLSVLINPNPISDVLHLQNVLNSQVNVYNSLGACIFNSQVSKTNNCDISTNNWPSGFYFIKINSTNQDHQTFKIIKE